MTVRFERKRGYWLVDTRRWPDGLRTRKWMPDEGTAIRINKKIEVACADEERIWRRLRRDLGLDFKALGTFRSFVDTFYVPQYVEVYNRDQGSKASKIAVLCRHLGKVSFEGMTLQNVSQFVGKRKDQGRADTTIHHDLDVLHHIYEWAVEQEYLTANPIGRMKFVDEDTPERPRPREECIDEIMAAVDSRALPVYSFLRDTGARRGEAITLTRDQLDLAKCEVVLKNIKIGKSRSRRVPLTDLGLWAVQAMPQVGEYVFYNPDTLEPWTGDAVAIPWERAREAVGHPRLCIHDLRHAYAIKLAEAGCPMHYISEMLDHTSVDFTRKRYARFSPEAASKHVLKVLQGLRGKK